MSSIDAFRNAKVGDTLVRRLRITVRAGGAAAAGFTGVLTPGGLTVTTRVTFDPGVFVTGVLLLQDGRSVPLSGVVRRSERPTGLLAQAVAGSMEIALVAPVSAHYASLFQGAGNAKPAAPVPVKVPLPVPANDGTSFPPRPTPSRPAQRRCEIRLSARYEVFVGAARIQPCETRQLEEGGCSLATQRVEAVSSRVFVHLALPTGQELKLLGTVAWARPGLPARGTAPAQPAALGVRFEAGQRQLAALCRFLEGAAGQEPGCAAEAGATPALAGA